MFCHCHDACACPAGRASTVRHHGQAHWIDSYKALIVPAMVNAFGIFWMRQYIASAVHTELIEAGRIDGGGHFRIFWNIAIPVVTPAMATLGILNFMNVWNDFFWPLVVLKTEKITPFKLRANCSPIRMALILE